jgi:hypothetical protein
MGQSQPSVIPTPTPATNPWEASKRGHNTSSKTISNLGGGKATKPVDDGKNSSASKKKRKPPTPSRIANACNGIKPLVFF